MKKTRSEKSRDTVPLSKRNFRDTVPLKLTPPYLRRGEAATDGPDLGDHPLLVLGGVDVLALDEEARGKDGRPLRVEAQVQAVGRGEVAVHRVHGPHEVRLCRVARRLVQQDQVRVAHRVEMPGRR
jgi:hypothetical protein